MGGQFILIRHGESEGNTGVSRDPDCALTPRGTDQARQLGRRLAGIDLREFAGIVSPYTRARQTAALIAEATGLSFETEELVREWGDLASINGREYPSETEQELVERLTRFVKVYGERNVLVVSHASPIAVLTQLAWGEIPNFEGPFWLGVANCSLRWVRVTV